MSRHNIGKKHNAFGSFISGDIFLYYYMMQTFLVY